jgi:hypothetical protein
LLGPKNREASPFVAMRQAARRFPAGHGMVVVLLDTVSRISNLSPTSGLDPSLRPQLNGQGLLMFSPIYVLPTMDLTISRIKDGESRLDYHLDPKVLYELGRPLWSASLSQLSTKGSIGCLYSHF